MKSKSILVLAVLISWFAIPKVEAEINFNDGEIHDIDYFVNDWIYVDYQSPSTETIVNILLGADIDGLIAWEDSRVHIFGGQIGGTEIIINDRSITTLYGVDFKFDGTSVDYGEYTSAWSPPYKSYWTITGTLASDEIINKVFNFYDNATVVLAPIPEPTTLLLLGLGAVMLRRKC